MNPLFINFVYVVSAALFIFGLKMLSSPATARRGNLLSSLGMLIAIIVTLMNAGLDYKWVFLGILIGSGIGAFAALRVEMTAMPEMVALFNGFGGISSLLLAWAEYHQNRELFSVFIAIVAFLSAFIGGVTFSGSMVAFAKLSGKITQKAVVFKGQHIINGVLLLLTLIAAVIFCITPASTFGYVLFTLILLVALGFGISSTIPIGGADMPVVISLLNSYSGLAACAAGFVISNNILIVAGALVGASGIILTNIMCKAMNRSLVNVLFSGFGNTTEGQDGVAPQGEVRPASAEDVYYILEAADAVVFVPGYGLAVAQAQHAVKELGDLLEKNNTEVSYAIHPVAGRMPGHMNVLLAEANVPYDQLVEMDDINPRMDSIDVCVVIGANDVVNPAALDDESSPIYGMPIIETHRAKTVIVLKRSMNPGFAGIQNALFFAENTRMYFGDAKTSIQALVAEFKND
ncbi:MAG: NAD(P)(+) transhydrogenase (Re/Si-specific) subunit beta [Candidatus Electrothrix sp. GW3-4]|uniref:NAD(P)(+) transhydrogenase (Re/Si-specific) subunit beta n=1 Tax=Candidatus Electrothrix sp. GW3-4 TaxID=3126740 RepID=UPI0030CA907E